VLGTALAEAEDIQNAISSLLEDEVDNTARQGNKNDKKKFKRRELFTEQGLIADEPNSACAIVATKRPDSSPAENPLTQVLAVRSSNILIVCAIWAYDGMVLTGHDLKYPLYLPQQFRA
jgi:hypothetical protein